MMNTYDALKKYFRLKDQIRNKYGKVVVCHIEDKVNKTKIPVPVPLYRYALSVFLMIENIDTCFEIDDYAPEWDLFVEESNVNIYGSDYQWDPIEFAIVKKHLGDIQCMRYADGYASNIAVDKLTTFLTKV